MTAPQVIFTLATLLAALGMWLLLPRGTAGGRMTGAVLALVALGMWASQLPGLDNWIAGSVFYILASVTVVAAAAAVTFRDPVHCAIWFGLSLCGTAGLFLLAGAQFLAMATLVVYAGAILVTFLFVLMLAQPEGKASYDRRSWEAMLAATTGAVLVGILSITVGSVFTAAEQSGTCEGDSPIFVGRESGQSPSNLRAGPKPIAVATEAQLAEGVLHPQHMARLGGELFGRHLVAVEVAGTLLLAALVGAAVIIAQGKKDGSEHHGATEGAETLS